MRDAISSWITCPTPISYTSKSILRRYPCIYPGTKINRIPNCWNSCLYPLPENMPQRYQTRKHPLQLIGQKYQHCWFWHQQKITQEGYQKIHAYCYRYPLLPSSRDVRGRRLRLTCRYVGFRCDCLQIDVGVHSLWIWVPLRHHREYNEGWIGLPSSHWGQVQQTSPFVCS